MLEFPANDGVEVFATRDGRICFKSAGDLKYIEQEQTVYLTIGQFRSVIKHADDLINTANSNRLEYGVNNG